MGLYAIGSELIEVLLSPIVEACPFENKTGVMSLLHSFYCWGTVGVILGSTLFFALFGIAQWKILTIIWALSHLNSILGKAYGDIPAIVRFEQIYGREILPKLGISLIPPAQVSLTSDLHKKTIKHDSFFFRLRFTKKRGCV